MKQFLSILCVAILALTVVTPAYSQQAPDPNQPKTAAPPMVEVTSKKPLSTAVPDQALLQEENFNLKAQLAQAELQKQMAPLQAGFAATEKILTDWIEQQKKENGWGNEVSFNRVTRKFEKPAPVAAAPAAKPAAPEKK